jgi:hypothetical protein
MLRNSGVAAQLTVSEGGLSSMELVTAGFLHSLSHKSGIRCTKSVANLQQIAI